jgi:hypothetical protein
MHKNPIDPSEDLDIHFLQPPVTEKMINDHWGAILLRLEEDGLAGQKNNSEEIKNDSTPK